MFRKLMTVVVAGALATPATAQDLRLAGANDLLRTVELQLATSEYQLELMTPTLLHAQNILTAVQPTLTATQMSLQAMAPNLSVMGVRLGSRWELVAPRDKWFPQDTADALYRRARSELNSRNYQQAIDYFRQLRESYAQSQYLARAYYYEAFALSRLNAEASYRQALTLLDTYRNQYSQNWTSNYASLYTQLQGRLARLGDTDAAAALAQRAAPLEKPLDSARLLALALRGGMQRGRQSDEDDDRMQALNALAQMRWESALPILRDVMANKDSSRVKLRRRALMIVAQKRGEGREDILIDAAQNDPDLTVREQAVQWLSAVRTDRAIAALDSILQFAAEESLQEKAILALSQHRGAEAGEILQRYAQRSDISQNMRLRAIQWLGQRRDAGEFLRNLYAQSDDRDVKERLIMALWQQRDEENSQFLLDIAMDEAEDMRLRSRALNWLGQRRNVTQQLYGLYDRVSDPELKEQLLMVYGQRGRDSTAVELLITIVRSEQNQRLRSRAIFWLGQTRSARAAEALREIINRD